MHGVKPPPNQIMAPASNTTKQTPGRAIGEKGAPILLQA